MSLLKEVQYKDIFSPQTLATLKGKSAISLRQMMGNKNIMQAMMRTLQLLPEISKIEAPYRDILENEAVDIVKKAYPLIDYADIKIDAKIVDELGESEGEEGEDENIEIAPEDKKRRLINAITQGSSVRGAFAYLLFRESLDTLDESLVEKYNELLKITFGSYDDDQVIAMALAMLAQNQKVGGGKSEVKYNEEEDKFVIHAEAINFPFLVHEIVKGLFEILSLQGFSTDREKNKSLVKRVDKVSSEPEDIRYGKFIYDGINQLFVNSEYDDPRVRDFLYTEIYRLEDEQFLQFIDNIINNKLTPQQKSWVSGTLKQINSDLKKDDTNLDDLD